MSIRVPNVGATELQLRWLVTRRLRIVMLAWGEQWKENGQRFYKTSLIWIIKENRTKLMCPGMSSYKER